MDVEVKQLINNNKQLIIIADGYSDGNCFFNVKFIISVTFINNFIK